jgi:hypothetical protein
MQHGWSRFYSLVRHWRNQRRRVQFRKWEQAEEVQRLFSVEALKEGRVDAVVAKRELL